MREKWSTDVVTKRLSALLERGEKANVSHIKKHHPNLYMAARRHFGSWKQAVESVGLDYEKVRLLTRKNQWGSIITIIRAVHLLDGRLDSKYVQVQHPNLYMAARRHFGYWSKALEAAGISYRAHYRSWSTKAWLRHMSEEQFKQILAHSSISAAARKERLALRKRKGRT